MKKALSLLIASIFILGLYGCGNKTEKVSSTERYKTVAQEYMDKGDFETAKKALEEGIKLTNDENLKAMLKELEKNQDEQQLKENNKSKLIGEWYYTAHSNPETKNDFQKIEIIYGGDSSIKMLKSDGSYETLSVVSETVAERIAFENGLNVKYTYSFTEENGYEQILYSITNEQTGDVLTQSRVGGYRKETLDTLYEDDSIKQETYNHSKENVNQQTTFVPSADIIKLYDGSVWEDIYSERCNMRMTYLDKNYFRIEITWGSGAYETYKWELTAEYRPDRSLHYTDCHHYIEGMAQGGSYTETRYINGTGYFELVDGNYIWNNVTENSYNYCCFR